MLMLDRCDIHVWRAAPEAPPAHELAFLSADEQARAARFHFDVDRHRFQRARCLLRRVLSQYAERDPADWCFEYNAWGKPSILPGQCVQPLYFNVSHSRHRIVCAVARFADLGIDVEDRVPDDFHALAGRFFAPAEIEWLRQAAGEDDARYRFLTLWTLKEAWLKARGTGLSTPLDHFSILPDDGAGDAVLDTSSDIDAAPHLWRFSRPEYAQPGCLALAFKPPPGVGGIRLSEHEAADLG